MALPIAAIAWDLQFAKFIWEQCPQTESFTIWCATPRTLTRPQPTALPSIHGTNRKTSTISATRLDLIFTIPAATRAVFHQSFSLYSTLEHMKIRYSKSHTYM